MTLDNSQTPAAAAEPQAATKPARRRATRTAAPPRAAVETGAPEPQPEPAVATPEPSVAAEAAPTTTRRTSRRATRATTTPPGVEPAAAQAPAEPVAPRASDVAVDPAPAPAAKAPRRRAAAPLDVLSEFGVPAPSAGAEPAGQAAPVVDVVVEAAPTTRRRASRKAAAADQSAAPAAPAAEPVDTERDSEPTSTRPRRRRAVRSEPQAPAAVEHVVPSGAEQSVTVVEAPAATAAPAASIDAPVAETPAAVEPPAAPSRRRRAASRPAAAAAPVAETEPPVRAAAPRTTSAPRPAASTPEDAAPAAPRLATTALLFQAPDLTPAPHRSRRAQSPAGPPRHVEPETAESVPATGSSPAADAPAPAAEAVPAETAPTPEPAPRERRSRRAERATGAVAEALAASGAAPREPRPAPAPTTDELTKDELAAIDEVEAIETELVAEGVEVPADEFGPADYRADSPDEGEPDSVADDDQEADTDGAGRRRRRRGGRGRKPRPEAPDSVDTTDAVEESAEENEPGEPSDGEAVDTDADGDAEDDGEGGSSRRRRRRRRSGRLESSDGSRRPRSLADEVTALKGSTRLEAKRQRRREGRDAGRRRQIITEAEFLARREAVERSMVVRERDGRTQIAVLEDGVLVEHYVSQQSQASMAGNVYLGRVQNVLPSMEAAFIDVGKGRNAVLYAGEVNWDAAGLEGQPRRIEQALKSGDSVLVQVTKDPIGHKGARLTSQVTLAGRYLVLVPGGGMTGISRKLPDTERARLKKILRDVVPEGSGVIVRTAAEGASEEELRADVERLQGQWAAIESKAKSASAPALLQGEPDLAIRVVRDIFNDDFSSLVVQGDGAWQEISTYVEELAPDLRERVSTWTGTVDLFTVHRVDEQLAKGLDRKVWLPSGGSLVIDRTEAMTVVDVNTGKFTGAGGTLEETVTRNNLEAAEEIVRQLRLRDIGGIIVIDFIDMVLESNRDLVLRRLVECLGRDRTKHQVAEVTSLGLVQMTRKRVGQGLVEAFSQTCEHCHGRGFIVHSEPVERQSGNASAPAAGEDDGGRSRASRRKRAKETAVPLPTPATPALPSASSETREAVKATLATIAAAAAHAHDHRDEDTALALPDAEGGPETTPAEAPAGTDTP